jgi:hypothetical protein
VVSIPVTQETRVQFPASEYFLCFIVLSRRRPGSIPGLIVFFGVSLRVDPKVLGRVDPKGLGRVHGSKGAGASAWIQRVDPKGLGRVDPKG